MYLSNRRSPYRNYIYGEMPEDGVVVYILLVLQDADADALEAELKEMDTEQERFSCGINGNCRRHTVI